MPIAAEFAKTRYTLGVPISTLQGISHPLANIAITVAGRTQPGPAGGLVPGQRTRGTPELARRRRSCSWPRRPPRAATMAVHVQGGLGVSAEAAATAYLVRARGWALAGGDPAPAPVTSPRSSPRARAEPARSKEDGQHGLLTSRTVRRRTRRFRTRCAASWRASSPTRSSAATVRPATTSTRACTWRWAPRAIWQRSSTPRPTVGSPGCGGGSGNWRSAAPTRPWVTWGTTVDGGALGGQVRLAGAPRRGAARGVRRRASGCAWVTPNPRAAPTSPPARPGRCATVTSWIINGSKMFTTGAHNGTYVFLITNTDPDAPKHKSLTMFLVPLDLPGRRDPGHPHRRRGPHQHRLLQRRPGRRQVPAR